MTRSLTKTTAAGAKWLVGGLAILMTGCGNMQQSQLSDQMPEPAATVAEEQRIPVIVGDVTALIDQPADVRESVCRYLRDLTAAEIGRHGAFILVNANAAVDLLPGFDVATAPAVSKSIAPRAAFDVEVTRLEEKLGATVKVGFVSSQRKHAIAEVKVTFRNLAGGRNLAVVREGKSSKGAWGAIATVNRKAMKGGQAEWELDGSMIGMACAVAVRDGVDELEKHIDDWKQGKTIASRTRG